MGIKDWQGSILGEREMTIRHFAKDGGHAREECDRRDKDEVEKEGGERVNGCFGMDEGRGWVDN